MESRLRVAVDIENGNTPVIHIAKKQSEDVRDDLISVFIEQFPTVNRWAKILYKGEDLTQGSENKIRHYHIVPISVKELEDEVKLMTAYIATLKEQTVTL